MWIYGFQVSAWLFAGFFAGVAFATHNGQPIIAAVLCAIAGIIGRALEEDDRKIHKNDH